MGEMTKKVQERRLKWYGHVMRREEHYVGRRAIEIIIIIIIIIIIYNIYIAPYSQVLYGNVHCYYNY